jgi:hypothetical protein
MCWSRLIGLATPWSCGSPRVDQTAASKRRLRGSPTSNTINRSTASASGSSWSAFPDGRSEMGIAVHGRLWLDRLRIPSRTSFLGPGTGHRSCFRLGGEAFGELKLKRLTAIVHPENHASINVLHKLGFGEERRAVVMGMNSIVYRLTPGGWQGICSHQRSALSGLSRVP